MENIQDNIGKHIRHNIEGKTKTKMYHYINCNLRHDIKMPFWVNVNIVIGNNIEKNISPNIIQNIIQKSKAVRP